MVSNGLEACFFSDKIQITIHAHVSYPHLRVFKLFQTFGSGLNDLQSFTIAVVDKPAETGG